MSLKTLSFLVFFVCLFYFQGLANATVEVYPGPSGVTVSQQYTVELHQDGKTFSSFVYQIANPNFVTHGPTAFTYSSTQEQSNAWTTFSFSGDPVTVQVTNQKPFTAVRILPSRHNIVPAINGQTISFTLTNTVQMAIDFCYSEDKCPNDIEWDITNPLLVFSNPLQGGCSAGNLLAKPGQSVPTLNASQTGVCFGPGVYDLGTSPYVLGMDSAGQAQTAFLAGGAYVKGAFMIADNVQGTIIGGRGILSGEDFTAGSLPGQCHQVYGGTSCPYMINGMNITGGALIQGITIINAPFYNIMLGGTGNTVQDLKEISWYGQTDGVSVAGPANPQSSLINDDFFKVGDDAIKLFSSNLTVTGCTIWQLDNASPFELGVNQSFNTSNVIVKDSDVIRSEEVWPTRSNGVFAAANGGNANKSNFTFSNITVDNSYLQLFKIAVVPNQYTKPGFDSLGSLNKLTFNNIKVKDQQVLPNLFQSFDLGHQVSNVAFNGVNIAGHWFGNPSITFNANRNYSLNGNVFSGLLWESKSTPQNFLISLFSGPDSVPSSWTSFSQSQLTSGYQVKGIGDFYGDGYASALLTNTKNNLLSIWKDPVQTNLIQSIKYSSGQTVGGFGPVAGVGQFHGDGYTDVLMWNFSLQQGRVILLNGAEAIGSITFSPKTASNWSVAGVGDFTQTGYSDVMLRDTKGNVEIIYFGKYGVVNTIDYTSSNFYYSSTANYNKTWGATTGHFDTHWTVAGIGDFQGDGYAGILWLNPSTGQLGISNFITSVENGSPNSFISGQVFAQIPYSNQIAALGDFNGDGTADILLYDPATSQYTIWYTGYYAGNLYEPGPTFATSGSDWQIQGQ